MKATFTSKEGVSIVEKVILTIQENKQYLSDIDGLIGDGDHGVNMNKGFTMAGAELEKQAVEDVSKAFSILYRTLLVKIGGSMGPLYGQLFKGVSEAFKEKENLGAEDVKLALANAVENIQKISPAQVGDKTLLDTLVPASNAYAESLAADGDFAKALQTMQAAAKAGAESTKDMVAKLGRASRLGERSRGVQDAGATSCYLILNAMGDSILALINE